MAAVCFLAGCAPTAQPLTAAELETYPEARGIPASVQHFIVRWQDCQHWLGEPGWDDARRREIERAVADICQGIDLYGRDLRRLHAGHPEVLVRLRDYEPLGQ